MSLFMNNRPIVSKQYQKAFQLSKYCIASILFKVCRLLELDSGKWVFGYTESIFPVLACINSIASIVCF